MLGGLRSDSSCFQTCCSMHRFLIASSFGASTRVTLSWALVGVGRQLGAQVLRYCRNLRKGGRMS